MNKIGWVCTTAGLLILMGSPAVAEMAIRAAEGRADGCMRLSIVLRLDDDRAVKVMATAGYLADFTVNGVARCSRVHSCSFSWLKRNMIMRANSITVVANAPKCSLGITSYVDLS